MNPRTLYASHYRSFRDLYITFPHGITAITGANGAGKSSIVNAIELCLFGGKLAPHLAEGDDRMAITLIFEHDNELYRIARSYSSAGRGKSTLDFDRNALRDEADELGEREDSWVPLARESAKATQELIEETIGFTRSTWRSSSFLAQGDGAAFTEADPRERKAVLTEAVLGRDPIWPKLLELVRADKRELDSEYAGLNVIVQRSLTELLVLDATVAAIEAKDAEERDLELAYIEAVQSVDEAEAAMAKYTERIRVGAMLSERRSEILERKAKLQAVDDAANAAVRDLPDVDRQIAEQEALAEESNRLFQAEQSYAAAVQTHDQRAAEVNRLVGEAQAAADECITIAKRITEIEDEVVVECPTCGQTLHAEAREQALIEMQRMHTAAVEQAERLFAQARAIEVDTPPLPPEARTEDMRNADRMLGILQERKRVLNEAAAAVLMPEHRQARAAIEADLDALAAEIEQFEVPDEEEGKRLMGALAGARLVRDERNRRWSAVAAEQAMLDAEVKRLRALQEQTVAAQARCAEIGQRLARVDVLERAYSQNGIPALLIENTAIPQIETEANRILGELGGTAVGVQLHTLRDLKSGDGLADTLDIVINTETSQRAYETLSGGERSRVNVALRIALAALLASRRGAESQLLVIDEPDGLDQEGFGALLGVLEGLTGTFRKILVVSHHPELRDSIEQTIRLEKNGGRSEVVV